jgi:hypothetical protein
MLVHSTLPTLLLGDFKLQMPLADPLRFFRHGKIHLSEPFMDLATERGSLLLNSPGIHTHFPHSTQYRPSTIDLAFINQPLTKFRTSWDNSSPPTSSDHTSPHTRIFLSFTIPPYTTPDWNNIDWTTTSKDLENLTIPDYSLHSNLDS